MRRQATFLTTTLILGIGIALAAPAPSGADKNKVDELITQLGSQNFRQRDAASKELDAIGDSALEALRKAAKSSDMEIADRAAALIVKIEARNENTNFLAPTYVELSLKEATVEYAVSELAKKSGYAIVLGGDKSKLADRKVTLETGKVPFWKALEMLCEKAQLNESDVAVGNVGATPGGPSTLPVRQAPPIQVRPINQPQPVPLPVQKQLPPAPRAPQGFSVEEPVAPAPPVKAQAVPVQRAQPPVPQPAPNQPAQAAPPPAPLQVRVGATTGVMRVAPNNTNPTIVLADGKPNSAPTFVDGAIRIRSVKNPDQQAKPPEGEISLFLEVKPEPKIQIQQVLGVKIDKAIDNNDQALEQSMVAENANPQGGIQQFPNGGPRPAIAIARPIRVNPINSPSQSAVPVRLKKGDKDATSIKELRGVVSLKIRTPAEDLVSIENVLKAKGEAAKGKADVNLKIIDVSTEKNGDIKFEVELQIPNDVQAQNGNVNQGMIQLNGAAGNVRIQIAPAGPVPPPPPAPPQMGAAPIVQNYLGLDLIDAKGNPLKLVQMMQTRGKFQQNGRTVVATITYRPEKDQEAAKLVFKGTRPAAVNVPFVLKDIPVK